MPGRRRWGLWIFLCLLGLLIVVVVGVRRSGLIDEGGGPLIGVVQISGPILDAQEGIDSLRRFRKDNKIRAIVVRINSPGGMVGPAQELYREVTITRQTKPVVASLGGVAASGGYYVAAAAEKIVASPGTLTGSIGVISQTTEMHELLDLARVRVNVFKTGAYKDTGSPLRPMSETDRTLIQDLVSRIHQQFVRDVAKGRKLEIDAVAPIADGRLLTGEDAQQVRLVDRLGNFSDALEEAATLALAPGDPVPRYERKRSRLIEWLVQASARVIEQVRWGLAGPQQSIEARAPGLP